MGYPKYAAEESVAVDVDPEYRGSLEKNIGLLQERVDVVEMISDRLGARLRGLRVDRPVPPLEKFEESGSYSSISNQIASATYRVGRIEMNLRQILEEIDL